MSSNPVRSELLVHVHDLLAEERALREGLAAGTISEADEHARIIAVEAELDQIWDLLRQRDALRDSGGSPDEAVERPVGEVEGYLQ